ncbi:MAG TPA: hypothetical protein VFE62_04070 [Gemmataceae bacterium]|nr:hypothetical protein [Gemmataceae bacterium]
MAFNAASFKANPITYLGQKQFITPGTTGSLTSTDITGSAQLPGSDMEVKTVSNQTSLKYFSVADGNAYVATMADSSGDFRAYWLPWRSGYAFKMTLGSTVDVFITAKMNSCGIIIGGPEATPTVIHANTENVTVPVFDKNADIATAMQQARSIQTSEYKLAYGNLAAQAIRADYFGTGKSNVGVIDPEFYLTDKLTSMSVFGIRASGTWTFYANLHTAGKQGITMEIWPTQPKTLPRV